METLLMKTDHQPGPGGGQTSNAPVIHGGVSWMLQFGIDDDGTTDCAAAMDFESNQRAVRNGVTDEMLAEKLLSMETSGNGRTYSPWRPKNEWLDDAPAIAQDSRTGATPMLDQASKLETSSVKEVSGIDCCGVEVDSGGKARHAKDCPVSPGADSAILDKTPSPKVDDTIATDEEVGRALAKLFATVRSESPKGYIVGKTSGVRRGKPIIKAVLKVMTASGIKGKSVTVDQVDRLWEKVTAAAAREDARGDT